MSEEIDKSKLGTELVRDQKGKTCTKIKFTDYAVERFQGDFIGPNGKIRERIRVPFDISRNTALKGLKL